MPRPSRESKSSEQPRATMGPAPAILAKRNIAKSSFWCTKKNIEFDPWCDADNPKTVTYKQIARASAVMRGIIPETQLLRSRTCEDLKMELFYKYEIYHRTGSFNERGALYSLLMLTPEEKLDGVVTASMGNFAMALAYHGRELCVPVTVVLPTSTPVSVAERCAERGAGVVRHGATLADAKRHAFILAHERGVHYLNGYDHPHAIAGAGCIGLEILQQLPTTDAIIVPIGGGGLIAGIAAVAKHIKPGILIYGVEPDKCCSFFKAMENELPYKTDAPLCLASSLAVPSAGVNAFHTAKSLIDKLVLIDDDWVARAMLHVMERERVVVEGAGAAGLAALLTVPEAMPELKGKTVVCILTGGNVDVMKLPFYLERAKAAEGRIIKMTVKFPLLFICTVVCIHAAEKATIPADDTKERTQLFSMISNLGGNILKVDTDRAWTEENDFYTIYLSLTIEVLDLAAACRLRRVMARLFPDACAFVEEPFDPVPMCVCFPGRHH